jgi:hypothetical protein
MKSGHHELLQVFLWNRLVFVDGGKCKSGVYNVCGLWVCGKMGWEWVNVCARVRVCVCVRV